jgi:hypothetical protein
MSSKSPQQSSKRRTKPTKPVQRPEPASTEPEELSPDERTEIALKLAAEQERGRPPSI